MSTKRLIALLTALGAASLLVPGAGRADDSPPNKAVRECIERNGARYATPDKAWISQYVSLEDACRARFGKQADVTLTVTPLATGVTAKATVGARAAATIESSSSGRATTAKTRAAKRHRTGTAGGSTAARKASAAAAVNATLSAPQVRESVSRSGFASGWLVAVLLALTFSAAAVRIVRRR